MQQSFTTHQLDRRANMLLRSVRNVPPTSDAIRELAEVSIKLEDAPVKPTVVARLTVIRANGRRTIVEIHQDASFHSFYYFYTQDGNRRSTKQLLRKASRNEGSFLGNWGLGAINEKLHIYQNKSNPITTYRLRIFQKRAYKRLLSVSPDQIGVGRGS